MCDCRGDNVSLGSRDIRNPADFTVGTNHVQFVVIRFYGIERSSNCDHAIPRRCDQDSKETLLRNWELPRPSPPWYARRREIADEAVGTAPDRLGSCAG